MKSVKMFGKSIPLLAIVMISVLAIGASAALLTYYGSVTSEVTVDQAILLDGQSWPASDLVADEIVGVGGDAVLGDEHYLTSQSEENKIVVNLVTAGGYDTEAIIAVFPMYRLDSIEGDDAISVVLDTSVSWGTFTGVSFNYLIETDLYQEIITAAAGDPLYDGLEPWIPQINVKLLDGEGELAYYASWHSFRHGITGTVDEPTSITALKGDFYLFTVEWGLIGLYSEYAGDKGPIDACTFTGFSQQAGDTSSDPNDPSINAPAGPNDYGYYPSKSAQVVWVGNYGMDVKGIVINPVGYSGTGYDAVRDRVEFVMLYVFSIAAAEDTYSVTTNVVPVGLP